MSDVCHELHLLMNSAPVFNFPFDIKQIPLNGVYVLFETGEFAHGANRIVRVGTHTGVDQLRSRLRQHFLKEHKDRSIFRKNIGRALLNREQDPFLEHWNWKLMSRAAKEKYGPLVDSCKQQQVEKQVSEYIQRSFSFVVFRVDDKNTRLSLESKLISTVSRCDACMPSERWLGASSPLEKIRQSGLWLVNELYKQPLTPGELDELRPVIAAAPRDTAR